MLYFAYGSNMSTRRMRARIPSAEVVGPASIQDRVLVCNKLGRDGSGKANLVPRPGRTAHGVLYAMSEAAFQLLDTFETGYRRVEVCVVTATGKAVRARMYEAELLTDDAVPFDWYREHILAGAREHGLPRAYLRHLECLPYRLARIFHDDHASGSEMMIYMKELHRNRHAFARNRHAFAKK